MKLCRNRWQFLVITAIMCLLPSISNSKTDEKKGIYLQGNWDVTHVERQLFSPFTAYYDESILAIRNEKPACDLTITLTDVQTGSSVYTMEVSQENSAFITIPLDGLGRGEYCLTISHPEAGYVYGTFNL